MTHGIPGHWIKLLLVAGRHLDRSYYAAICPLAHLIVRPNNNVGSFACLRRQRKTIGNLLRCFDPYWNPVILFELVGDQLHGGSAVGIHPDQQLTVGPAASSMDRRKEQNRDQISAHEQDPMRALPRLPIRIKLRHNPGCMLRLDKLVDGRDEYNHKHAQPQKGAMVMVDDSVFSLFGASSRSKYSRDACVTWNRRSQGSGSSFSTSSD